MSTLVSDLTAFSPFYGHRYDGRTAQALPVRVYPDGNNIRIEGEGLVRVWSRTAVKLAPPLGSAMRRLDLPDGSFVELADRPDLDRMLGNASRGWLDWLESRLSAVVAALVALIAVVVAAYLWGLPWGARLLAEQVPLRWTSALSDSTIVVLDNTYVGPTTLSEVRQASIRNAFARWRSPGNRHLPPYRLLFRDGKRIGANALALPSGDIVVTDQLVKLAGSDEEILGVLAHELGHVDRRHAMRQLIQGSFVGVTAAVWFGDVSMLAGLSTAMLSMRYSRDFEREADTYAADMMLANGVSPMALGRLLIALEESESRGSHTADAFMSTHPLTAERLEYLRQRSIQR
jgi:Zn-dependent protease with chaperone function